MVCAGRLGFEGRGVGASPYREDDVCDEGLTVLPEISVDLHV